MDFSGYPGDLHFYIDLNINSIGYYKVYAGFYRFSAGCCRISSPGDLVLYMVLSKSTPGALNSRPYGENFAVVVGAGPDQGQKYKSGPKEIIHLGAKGKNTNGGQRK